MSKNNTGVIIKLTRYYRYPLSMLERGATLQDAMHKIDEDLVVDMQESFSNPDHFRERLFETEVIRELPFETKRPSVLVSRRDQNFNVGFNRLVRVLVKNHLEMKYKGKIDPSVNPNLFTYHTEVRNDKGEIVTPEKFYLKEDIEQDFHNVEDFYVNLLSNMEAI